MKPYIHIFILLVFISFGSIAQKGKKDSFFNPLENSIDVAINSAKNAYAIGDYEKAKDISQRLSKSINTSSKRQELINLGIASDKQLKLRYEAHTALRNGEYDKAVQSYEKMLKANPRDVVAKGAIINVKRIINKPIDNSYETALREAKRLYDSALNNNRLSDQQRISNLEKARKIWVAIERTSNSTRVGLAQNINSANDLLSSARRLATADSKERTRIKAEITAKYPAASGFISGIVVSPPPLPTKSLFETTYAKGIYFLRDCNYNEALVCFKEAHVMRPEAAKTKKYYYDLQAINNLESQVIELKRSTNSSTKDILSLYERITKLNAGFELTQSNSSCTKTESVTCDYIWNELPNEATKFNCPQVLSFADRLSNCPPSRENQSRLGRLVSSCQNLDNNCIIANQQLISNRIEEANRLQSQGFFEASNSSFSAITTEIEKLKSTCKDFDAAEFEKQVSVSQRQNDEFIASKNCRDKQQIAFETGGNFTENQAFEKAIEIYNSIDTSCIDATFKNKLGFEVKRIETIYGQYMLKVYEDSASRSKSLEYYKDEGEFLDKAMAFADLEVDKNRIQTKIAINKCFKETGKKCEDSKPCKDITTIKQTNIQLLVGINLSSLNSEYLAPVVRFQSTIATGSYDPAPSIGLRLNRQSFKKYIDFNTSLLYTPSTKLSFLNNNGTTLSNLKYNNLDLDFNLKFHRLRDCNDEGRAYIFAGGNAGYKKLISSTTPAQATSDYVSENYSNVLLGGFQTGIGYELPKDKLNFEIEFKRQAMFSNGINNLKESNSIFNSPFSLGYVGIKLGYTLKNWTNPKQ